MNKKEEEYYKWATKNGVVFPKVKIENYKDCGVGGKCTEDIQTGEAIFKIPLSLAINYKTIRENEFVSKFYKHSKEMEEEIQKIQKDEKDGSVLHNADNFSFEMISLYLFLIFEKNNQNSIWKEWFQMLPTSYETFPLFYGKEELEQLEGSNLYRRNQ
jgi:hypothetical protein